MIDCSLKIWENEFEANDAIFFASTKYKSPWLPGMDPGLPDFSWYNRPK
jgi:hypothetical protein